MSSPSPQPIGRFAPSPSGAPHFGTLLAAVASYLHVHHLGGQWRLRIEDIDPPRVVPGAAAAILRLLDNLGLHWEGEVMYQSQRSQAYAAALDQLCQQDQLYPCACSRADYANAKMGIDGPIYPGHCRHGLPPGKPARSLRLRVPEQPVTFIDQLMGQHSQQLADEVGDFVLRRADQVTAYQLAVVVDDAAQGVNQVVRGADLLSSTARQIYLQQRLALPTPSYLHIPLLMDGHGHKLSKSDAKHPLPSCPPAPLLWTCLSLLGQQPPATLRKAPTEVQLQWAVPHWRSDRLPRQPIPLQRFIAALQG